MKFKEKQLEQEFWKLTPKARYLACYVDYLFWRHFKWEATITCIYYEGGSGIHSQWRAFDVSTKALRFNEIDIIKNFINREFPYDDSRPQLKSCIYHKVSEDKIRGYSLKDFVPEYHLHCQVWIV